jgi:hypothetical protein
MLKQPETKEELHDWCRTLLDDARHMRRGHETEWWENLSFYAGDLWAEFNPHSMRMEEPPAAEHRVRLAINLAQPVVRTEYAKLLKNRPIVECVARSADKSDRDAAKVGDKLLNSYAEKMFQLPRVRRESVIWALTCGRGAVFVDYDPSATGEVDVLVDPAGNPISDPAAIKAVQRHYRDKKKAAKTKTIPQGELRIRALGPMQWGYDFSVNDPDQASWQFVSETYDVTEVERRWGVVVEASKDVQPNLLEKRLLEKVDLTGTFQRASVSSSAQELVVIHRLFIRAGHLYFPDGAEIVFTESELIEATKFPWQHGQLPVSSMGHIPMPGSKNPLSVVGQVKGPVLELSKTESQLIENRNLMGNPPWIFYDYHQMEDDQLVNVPGAQLTIPWRPNGADPHPVEMPEMPGYIQELPDKLKEHIQDIAGQGETSQGRVPPGARSGVAIAYLQEEDDTKLGPTVSEFEEMNERFEWQMLSIMAECYDVPRTVRIYKKHSEPEVFDFIGTQLAGIAAVQVQAGSALPRSKAARQQFMMDLFSMGIETDPRKVKEMLELGEGEPEDFEVDMQQAERENDKMERGQPCNVEDWFNHQAHLVVHRRFMKSADFEALPPQIQQIYKDHDVLHQRFLTGVAAAQQQGVPVPGQTLPQPMVGNGENNQQAVQGGPLAQNGAAPPSPIDYQPQ